MKTVIIVQARMTSTRLPGKVLKEVLGKPLLEYLVERLRRVRQADAFVIATTVNAADDPIVALCERLGVAVTRGPELDVLARYHAAARVHGADIVVRVTSDCPLIDPELIDAMILGFREADDAPDYLSNTLQPTFPYGMAVEVFRAGALAEAHAEAAAEPEREHVTPFLYLRPERYRIRHYRQAEDLSRHRWTVDTPEDFELVRRLIEDIYPHNPAFRMADVLAALAHHPDWARLNAHIAQKALGQ